MSIISLLLICGFAQAGTFINNATVSVPQSLDGLKSVNSDNILIVDADQSTFTIAFTYSDSNTVDQWVFTNSADYNFVLDKFSTSSFFYTSIYGTNNHRRIPLKSITKAVCSQPDPAVQFYAVTLTLKNATTVNSNGYSSGQCSPFNP
jgi:hypothetical protein